METIRRKLILVALAACAGATASVGAHADDAYPTRPIKVIVPFTPGSGSDSSARFFGERITKYLGQGMVVENRPGANGIIALQAIKTLPADGYAVLLASNSPIAVNPLVLKNLPYDPVTDIKPVFGLSRGMNVVLVSNKSPFKTLGDLLAAARNKPLTLATYSAGYELAGQWLAQVSGSKFTNVPYKGQGQIMTDVIGDQVDFALVDSSGALELIAGGKLRALAVSGETRHPNLPNVPTIRESGFPDYVTYSWTSFYVRAQTPDKTVNTLAAALQKVMDSDEARDYMRDRGGELMPYPPAKMLSFQLAEIERFRKIAQKAGVTPK